MLEYVKSICFMFGSLFGFTRPVFYGGLVLLGFGLIVLALIISLIVKSIKKRNARKKKANTIEEQKVNEIAKVEEDVKPVEQTEQKEIVKEQPVAEEQVQQTEQEEIKEEVVVEKTQTKKAEKKPASTPIKKLNGKWVIEKESENEFVSKLLASNGEVMLTSEIYMSEEGARNGISTIIRSIVADNFSIYQDKNNNFYYKIKSANKRLLCVGEIYKSKESCLKSVESVKRIAENSPIVEGVKEGQGYAPYTPAKLDLTDGKKGKWRVVKLDNGCYSARLFASNGQLMLATEQVALEKSAKNAIESVKKNAEQGNFIIDRDKFGRFYYKLRNAQKSVICIGEAYESLDSCVSAIESVRRFSLTAVVVND